MLANINLLPQKVRRRFSSLLVWVIPVIFVCSGMSWMAIENHIIQKNIASEQQELAQTQKLIQAEESKIKGTASTSSAAELGKLDQWLQTNRYSTVKVLKAFTSYLPERGYFLSFQSAQGGELSIKVQFDSLDQISAYLYQLKNSSMVQTVTLANVVTQELAKSQQNTTNGDITLNSLPQDNTHVMPRYLAQFQIKLNLQEVRKDQAK
jgi:type IV pilus assembly protein PilN